MGVRRSPLLMDAANSALLVIDVQEKLLPQILGGPRMVWNISRLLQAARLLDVRVLATEQYPQGLGPTTADLRCHLPAISTKSLFSCAECADLFAPLADAGIINLLLCGIETHVCVQQTAFDLMAQGFNVFLAADAVGTRHAIDGEVALERLRTCGAMVTTTESVLFEWCQSSAHPHFKSISHLVRQPGP